jgi:hypothetical protein
MPGMRMTRRGRLVFGLIPFAVIAGMLVGMREPALTLTVDAPDDGALLNAEDADGFALSVDSDVPGALEGATLVHNEADVSDEIQLTDAGLRWEPAVLDDGDHDIDLRIPRRLPSRDLRRSITFTVDATPPELQITEPSDVVFSNEPALLAGEVEAGATVTVDGEDVEVSGGEFSQEFDEPPSGPVTVVATDPAGNETTEEVVFTVVRSRIEVDEPRALHVSFYGWATPSLREPVLKMAEEGKINSVQFDLKDESGVVGYNSEVPLAEQIGAVNPINNLQEAVDQLHDLGIHVSGRIVAFRDPVLASWAWENGEKDYVLQTPGGEPYAGYGGFTNFAHPDVRQYNIDIAKEAAAAGIDDILYDYVRRPDGPLENLEIPGLEGTPEEAIVQFVKETKEQLEPYRVKLGLSVYGIAATRPTQIAQDISGMAPYCDYVAPMLYPSHWGPGEFNVADPNRQPYDIIYRSLEDFLLEVEGTDCKVFPWLEDTSYRAWDRRKQVQEQIRATRDWGINGWLMWDPLVRYTPDAYEVDPEDPPPPEREPGVDRDPEVEEKARNASN